MVLYSVTWSPVKELTKGKGRIPSSENLIFLHVLCRDSKDALQALEYHFRFHYNNRRELTLDDGQFTLSRSKIDSRGFVAHYLLMDGMKQPLNLCDVKSNIHRISTIFGI